MYCGQCGNPLEDNARFCGRCGAPVQDAETKEPRPDDSAALAKAAASETSPAAKERQTSPFEAADDETGISESESGEKKSRRAPERENASYKKKAGGKKNLNKILTVIFSVVAAAAGLAAVLILVFGSGIRAQQAYDAIGDMSFADESILTAKEKETLTSLKEEREEALAEKDVTRLEELKSEWESFSAPINEMIEAYSSVENDEFFTEEEKAYLTSEELAQALEKEEAVKDAYQNRDETAFEAAVTDLETYSTPLHELFHTYDELPYRDADFEAFTDKEKALLSEETKNSLSSYKIQLQSVFEARDAETLSLLSSGWERAVSEAESELEDAKEQLLQDWANSANLTGDIAGLFSFGTVTSETSVEGHTITISTQYNESANLSDSQIKSALDSYISLMSSVFIAGVDELQQYVEDVVIRIEYKNSSGNVVASYEFN